MAGELSTLLTAAKTALDALATAGTVEACELMADKGEGHEAQLRRVGARPPFIVLAYNGGTWKEINQGKKLYQHTVDLTVLIGVASMQGRSGTRSSLLSIQDAVIGALCGLTLSQDIEAIEPVRTDLLTWGQGITVYGLQLRTRLPVVAGA